MPRADCDLSETTAGCPVPEWEHDVSFMRRLWVFSDTVIERSVALCRRAPLSGKQPTSVVPVMVTCSGAQRVSDLPCLSFCAAVNPR